MFNALEPWHLLIIVGVLVVLFGAKRLPDTARSLGRSMRIFRAEVSHKDDNPQLTPTPPTATDAAATGVPMATSVPASHR